MNRTNDDDVGPVRRCEITRVSQTEATRVLSRDAVAISSFYSERRSS